jgi:RNA polymerase sigma factor (sigma-70 family)
MKTDQGTFNELLLRLEPDCPDLEKSYKQLRLKLVKFFSWRRCEDPDSLADETIVRAIKNLHNGEEVRSSKPYSYIYAIATNVFREYLRARKKSDEITGNLADPATVLSEDENDCRWQCLQTLAPDKLRLLERYYLSEENREMLAQSLNVSTNALRLQIHRIKNELRECHKACLQKLSGGGN